MAVRLSQAERDYLSTQRLGRLATVAEDGQPQSNVQANPLVSLVVDDLASVKPWRVRGVEIRGRAETLTDWRAPFPGYSREAIRIHPERIIAWGLGEPA